MTNPSQDLVPIFYKRDSDSLEAYYLREFESDTGLFGGTFKQAGQLEAILKHITRALNDPIRKFATRRAILVVPHDVKEGEDITPLGLVSVRIVPRLRHARAILHYSYTWRTVEALVGFPYSLYGSVRFSQFLTKQIRARLDPLQSRQLEMDQVSYIAHSLHIFMDDYGQNIARRIVDDASF